MHYNFAATVANSQTHLLFLTLIINSTAWIRNCMDISFPKCWQGASSKREVGDVTKASPHLPLRSRFNLRKPHFKLLKATHSLTF